LERKNGDRKWTHLFLYRGHGKMMRLTAKLFHQCPTFSASKGKIFVAGGICHVSSSTNIRVIGMGRSQEGERRRTVWRGKHYASGNARWADTWDISPWPHCISFPVGLAQLILCARNYEMQCSSVGVVVSLWVGQQETCAVNNKHLIFRPSRLRVFYLRTATCSL
jgi:hypothetical protein